jgi:hypothetical protein
MKDIYNIVKVSDIDNIELDKIVRKCNDQPNLISYYYPHIFMNRDKINKDDLSVMIKKITDDIKRDKNVDYTLKKYYTISNIIETLFLCIFDLNTIKNFQKYIQLTISNNDNIIIDILNLIIQNKPLNNLELIFNNKIDTSNCVFIIEKIIEHIKKDYTDDCLEKQLLIQYQLISHIMKYTSKYKYNPYLSNILNITKYNLLNNYILKCDINESHDAYISNILEIYDNVFKQDEYIDKIDIASYLQKISKSLNIKDPKEKILKSIHRITFLDKIISLQTNPNYKVPLQTQLTKVIEENQIDKILINTYVNMIKTNSSVGKLEVIENIIKYFQNFGVLSKELIKLVFPKYFAKESIKYYLDIVARINSNTMSNSKLRIIEDIIKDQQVYENKIKHATIKNTSNLPCDKSKLTVFSIDNRFADNNCDIKLEEYNYELIGYLKFSKILFEREIFENLKNISIHNYLSNGVVEFGNTKIHANLLILNVLFMFNPNKYIEIGNLKKIIKDENLVNDIIHTLEYYNIILKRKPKQRTLIEIIYNSSEKIDLNVSFFDKKQEIKLELIKNIPNSTLDKNKKESNDSDKNEVTDSSIYQIESSKYDVIECFILKTIKPSKVNKNDLKMIVESKCNFSISSEGFNKCMTRLYNLDYFEYQGDDIVYVP